MIIKRREMSFLLLGGFIVIASIYYLFILSPALTGQKKLDKYIVKKEADLARMVQLNEKWEQFNRNKVEAEKIFSSKGKNFTLLSFLEGISREVGIQKKIVYMKPLSSPGEPGASKSLGMEVKLEGINVSDLVNFLYKLEYSDKLIHIKSIRIQKVTKGETPSLRVTLQANTYMK